MKRQLFRVLTLLICVLMLGTGVIITSAKDFTDVKSSDWYADYVYYMSDVGIINGYTDNTFRASKEVTRAEFIKMMVTAFGLEEKATINYNDISSGDWYYEVYTKASAQGFLQKVFTGYSMKPTAKLTREEAVSLLMAYLDLPESEATSLSKFTDRNSVTSDYKKYVEQAVYAGIINGFTDNTFRPKATLQRSQAAKILYTAVGTVVNGNINGNDALETDKAMVVTESANIIGVTINGDVIITEGVDDDVQFTNCEINGRVFVRAAGANVSFSGCDFIGEVNVKSVSTYVNVKQTAIDKLNVENNFCTVGMGAQSSVKTLNAAANLISTKITATSSNAKITKLVSESDITCENLTPGDVELGANITAYIGNDTYKDGFKGDVFYSIDGYDEFLTFSTYREGKVQYYLSATNNTSSFAADYANAKYRGEIDTRKDAAEQRLRVTSVDFDSYPYLIFAYVEGNKVSKLKAYSRYETAYGIAKDASLTLSNDGYEKLTFTTKASGGKLYYYYTNDQTAPSYSTVMQKYTATSAEYKGTLTVSGNTKKSEALGTAKYCVIFYANSTKVYEPVIFERPALTTGFKDNPTLTVATKDGTSDYIRFAVSSQSATLKWVYVSDSKIDSVEAFNAAFNKTSAKSGTATVYSTTTSVYLLGMSDAQNYTYVAIMLTINGTDYKPVVLKRAITMTGVADVIAYTNGNDSLFAIKTPNSGKYYAFFTNTKKDYDVESFEADYEKSYNKFTADLSANVYSSKVEEGYTAKYLAVRYIDQKGNHYKPEVYEFKRVEKGFTSQGKVSCTDGAYGVLSSVNVDIFDGVVDREVRLEYVRSSKKYIDVTSVKDSDFSVAEYNRTTNVAKFNYDADKPYYFIRAAVNVGGRWFAYALSSTPIESVRYVQAFNEHMVFQYDDNSDTIYVSGNLASPGVIKYVYTNNTITSVSQFNSEWSNASSKGTYDSKDSTRLEYQPFGTRPANVKNIVLLYNNGESADGLTVYLPYTVDISKLK